MAGTNGINQAGPIGGNLATVALRSESPIDDLAAALMQTIARRGRGFVLDVAADGAGRKVEVVESLRPVDEYEAPAAYRGHDIDDTDSFIAFCQRYGDKDKSLVFVGDDRCVLVLDEQKPVGIREMIELENAVSADWKNWSESLGKPMSHKAMGALLRLQEHNLVGGDLLAAIGSVKSTATVIHDSDLRDMGATVGVSMSVAAGAEMVRFPKAFSLIVPVLSQDELDGAAWATADIKVEVIVPEEPGKPLTFALHCSTWGQIHRRRLNAEAVRLREALQGWTVVRGSPSYVPRALGRNAAHYADLDQQ